MGVDYSANFGFGIQVDPNYYDEHQDDIYDILDDLPDYLFYFKIGAGNYTGDTDDFYICINNPLENGYNNLEEKANFLLSILDDKGIKYIDKPDIVGGLEIY